MDIEQSTLIWILRLAFLAMALLMTFGVWRFMRRERLVSVLPKSEYQPPKHIKLPEKNIILLISAKPGRILDNIKLFKAMHELGFQFAETNHVFEYVVPNTQDIAFSIINGRPPNTFESDPKKMSPTSTLIAVMQLPVGDGDNQVQYFHLLRSVLDELCNKLDADLCDIHKNLIKDKKFYEMQKEIETFEQSYTALIQNDYRQKHH